MLLCYIHPTLTKTDLEQSFLRLSRTSGGATIHGPLKQAEHHITEDIVAATRRLIGCDAPAKNRSSRLTRFSFYKRDVRALWDKRSMKIARDVVSGVCSFEQCSYYVQFFNSDSRLYYYGLLELVIDLGLIEQMLPVRMGVFIRCALFQTL